MPSAERTQSETKASGVQRVFKKLSVHLVRSKTPISSFLLLNIVSCKPYWLQIPSVAEDNLKLLLLPPLPRDSRHTPPRAA